MTWLYRIQTLKSVLAISYAAVIISWWNRRYLFSAYTTTITCRVASSNNQQPSFVHAWVHNWWYSHAIENYCNLGYRYSKLGDVFHKPNIYSIKYFCENCLSVQRRYYDTITASGGWLHGYSRLRDDKMEALTLTETGQIMKKFNSLIDWWILEVPSTASPLMDTGRSILTINLLMEQFKGYLSYFGV